MVLGRVIASEDGPSVFGFSFVIGEELVRRGQFVTLKTEEGILLGRVVNVFKTNRYFESIGAVKEFSKQGPQEFAFPTKDWEYTVANVKNLGVYLSDGSFDRVSYPPAPGQDVEDIEINMLNDFLGLDQKTGLDVGTVTNYDLNARFNLTRMFQKHVAILAMSGSGKSYGCSVIIEELLNRSAGKVGIVMIDNHGEYVGFADDKKYGDKVKIVKAEEIRLSTEFVSAGLIASITNLSDAQRRELERTIHKLRQTRRVYSIQDLIDDVISREMNDMVREALLSRLNDINRMNLFSTTNIPSEQDYVNQGEMTIINLGGVLDQRKKQIIVSLISKKLFNMRRKEQICPYVEIIEEAHNFCPSGEAYENAISRPIIETLAREGRKFHASLCLISQRPVKLSTTALSQCNTHVILRITNPSDLKHIRESAEAISSAELDMISSLKVGEALVIGEAVNYPVFFRFRTRTSKEKHSLGLEEYADVFAGKAPLAGAEDF